MNEDISELLEIVKKDIVLVENGDESPERLSELSDVFERMLELIKLLNGTAIMAIFSSA